MIVVLMWFLFIAEVSIVWKISALVMYLLEIAIRVAIAAK